MANTTLGRTFGVEIECVSNLARNELADRIRHAGVECQSESLSHHTRDYWRVTTDGSVGASGIEIVSPVLNWARGPEEIMRVCEVLRAAGCRVNPQCGLHVHVGVRHPSTSWSTPMAKRLPLAYARAEHVIDKWMPPSRRGDSNYYCRSLAQRLKQHRVLEANSPRDVIVAARMIHDYANRGNRYVKLNMIPVYDYGTVEFRQHSGTLDDTKVIQWAKFCLRFVDAAASYVPPAQTEAPAPAAATTQTLAAGTTPRRPRSGTARAVIFDMLTRPEGCTTREVLDATGWRQVSVLGTANQMGLTVRTQRVRETYGARTRSVLRFYADLLAPMFQAAVQSTLEMAVAPPLLPMTFTQDELFEYLGMPDDERLYWTTRARRLATIEQGASNPSAVGMTDDSYRAYAQEAMS